MNCYTTKIFGELLKPNPKENFLSLKQVRVRGKKINLEGNRTSLVSSARSLLTSTG